MRLKVIVGAAVTAVVLLAVLGALAWRAKYARGKTLEAVAVGRYIVMHQRVSGAAPKGPVAMDRLVSVEGVTGDEVARKRVPHGELLGVVDDVLVYADGKDLLRYDPRTLERVASTDEKRPPPLTEYGAMIDLGDAVLLLDTPQSLPVARVSRLRKEDQVVVWTAELPWAGHDTKLVALFGEKGQREKVVIVDADGFAAIYRSDGFISWTRP